MPVNHTMHQPPAAGVATDYAAMHSLCVSERRAPRGTCILRADDTGPRLRTIITGWAIRCRMFSDGRRQIVGLLLPGDAFGIETLFGDLLDHMVWSASAVTYEVLDGDAAARRFDADPLFRRYLLRLLAEEKVASERWMTQLGRCDAEERTASLLMQLYDRLSVLGLATSRRFHLELTQQDLADVLGLHLIHLNRILSRLRARGLILMHGQDITLLDLEGLAELVPIASHMGRLTSMC